MSRVKVRGAGGSKSAKGGGGGAHAVEASDSLHSKQFARVVDLISEGPIVGLVDGAKSVYLDETPLQNADNSYNFKDFGLNWTTGTQTQLTKSGLASAPFGFNDTRAETAVGVRVQSGSPVVRSITANNINTVIVTIYVPTLLSRDASNGNTNPTSVSIAIDLQSAGGGYVRKVTDTISGKTTSKYQRSYTIDVAGTGPWDIRVSRLTADSATQLLENQTWWDSYSSIVSKRLTYPNSALVAASIDSQQFQQIPSRAYDIKGLLVKIPSNYNPTTRAYNGTWDGTFVVAWTDNPAWCFYDMLTNTRYGLGDYIDSTQVDKWSLYTIARYCDEMVPSGIGSGMEPRFTCNLYLQSPEEAYTVIQNMASIFRAITYWATGTMLVVQDSPSNPVSLFTNANVIDGEFVYSGTSIKARHTVAQIAWNDPADFYRQKIEYVQDDDGVLRYGVKRAEIVAFGCTSRGQANRLGKWLLYSERAETETVTFKAGLDGLQLYPGAIIKTSDANRSGQRMAGRIVSATTTSATLDSEVTIASGKTYSLSIISPTGAIVKVVSNSSVGQRKVITFPAIPAAQVPQVNSVFLFEANDLVAETWRVISLVDADKNIVEVNAVKHDPTKFAQIELGQQFDPPAITALTSRPSAPINLAIRTSPYTINGAVMGLRATLSWTSPETRFRVRWRQAGAIWQERAVTEGTIDIDNIDYTAYEFQVYAVNQIGRESDAAILNQSITVPPAVLPALTGLALEGAFTSKICKIKWDACPGATSYRVEVRDTAANTSRRIVNVGDATRYDYSSSDMRADGGPWRAITFLVTPLGQFGSTTAAAGTLSVSNPQVGAVNGVVITPGIKSIYLKYTVPSDTDFIGVQVWLSTSANFTASSQNLVYDGTDSAITISKLADNITDLIGGTTYYIRVAGYDDFGKDSLTISGSISIVPFLNAPDVNSITESMLYSTLNDRINLIDGSASLPGSVASRISSEALLRTNADTANAASISTVQSRIYSRPNILKNGGFENGLQDWNGVSNWSIAENSFGKYAFLANPSGTNYIDSAKFSVNAGSVYTISGDSLIRATSGTVYFDLLFYGANNVDVLNGPQNALSSPHEFSSTDLNRNAHAVSATAPTNAVTAVARFVYANVVGGQLVACRQIKVEEGGLPATIYTAEASLSSSFAAIQSEQTARVSADSALSTRVDTVTANLGSTNASVQSISSAQATTNGQLSAMSAIKTQVTSGGRTYLAGIGVGVDNSSGYVESQILLSANKVSIIDESSGQTTVPFQVLNGATYLRSAVIADASINDAKITNLNGAKITAGSLSSNSLSVGVFTTNLLPNADFNSAKKDGAGVYQPDRFTSYTNLSGLYGNNIAGSSWNVAGLTSFTQRQPNNLMSVPPGNFYWTTSDGTYSDFIAVQPGSIYEFSGYSGAHRCSAVLGLLFYQSNGTYISTSLSNFNHAESAGGTSLSGYKRLFGLAQVPAGAALMRLCMFKGPTYTGQADSYAFWTQLLLAPASGTSQTEPSPWSPPAGGTLGVNIGGQITPTNSDNYLAPLAVKVSHLAADSLRTSNYAQDGNGYATSGAKLDNLGIALKIAPSGAVIGSINMYDYIIKIAQAVDVVTNKGYIWRGSGDSTVRGGAPNIDCLNLYAGTVYQDAGFFNIFSIDYIIQPVTVTAQGVCTDNLDGLRYIEMEFYANAGGSTPLFTKSLQISDRAYYSATVSDSLNATKGSLTISFRFGSNQSSITYFAAAPNALACHIRARIVNAYGPSEWRWFHPSTNVQGALFTRNNTAPSGSPSGGSGGGGGGGFCPAPWVKIRLLNGKEVTASSLHNGMQLYSVDDLSLQPVYGGGIVRDLSMQWAVRYAVGIDGRIDAAEFSVNHKLHVIDKGWVEVQKIVAGDVITVANDDLPAVVSYVKKMQESQVVSFRVEGAGTYFADGLLSHNAKVLDV